MHINVHTLTHIYMRGEGDVINFNTWRLCGFFFTFLYKYNSYFHNILWFLWTLQQLRFLTLYWLLTPARNYLICNPCPPRGRGGVIWVVLLHHYIQHNKWYVSSTHKTTKIHILHYKNLNMYMYCWFIFVDYKNY